jgi:hypothetical protein
MLTIKLKERDQKKLGDLDFTTTFKIKESGYVFMKIGVDGLTVRPVKKDTDEEEPKPIKVLIPENKVVVVCLNTGKAQFLNTYELVQIVEINAEEIFSEPTISKSEIQGDQ